MHTCGLYYLQLSRFMSMWTRMFPICVSSSLYSVKLCYRPSTKLPSFSILLSRTSFRWCFFTRWGNFQAHWLASLRASVTMHRWVPKQYHGVMNKPRQTQIQISTCWECVWQMLFSNLVNRTKACFHMCIVFVCLIFLEWFKHKFWIFTGLTPFRARCFPLWPQVYGILIMTSRADSTTALFCQYHCHTGYGFGTGCVHINVW